MKTRKDKYTQAQIEESIRYWSKKLLNESLADESEVRALIGEGLFKKAIGSIKRGISNVKKAYKTVKELPKNVYNKLFVPNDGVVKMLHAANKIAKTGVKLDGVKIYASLGEGKPLPVVGLAVANHKKTLILLVDPANSSAKPKTLKELRDFIVIEQKIKHPQEAIDSVICAEVSKEVLFESKLTDYIEKKKWSKDEALKPDALKELAKITRKGTDKTKAAVEKYFASEDGKKGGTKSTPAKKSAKKSAKKPTKKMLKKDVETKAEPSGEPIEKGNDAEEASSGSTQQQSKSTVKLYDNKLLDVKAEKDSIGFIFSKSKEEIALDKKFADAFDI